MLISPSASKSATIKIKVKESKQNPKNVYSTHDQIAGNVYLTLKENTFVHDLSITFNGRCTTILTNLQPWSNASASTRRQHTFLCVDQPIESCTISHLRANKASRDYEVPFTFTVPEYLTSHACCHNTVSNVVKQAHLLLPPSLGQTRGTMDVMDSFTPENAKIEYTICVRLKLSLRHESPIKMIEKELPVLVMPTRAEEPPLVLQAENTSYRMQTRKNVHNSTTKIRGRTGKLTATTSQPGPLNAYQKLQPGDGMTMLIVNLRFDPTDKSELPPHILSVRNQLHAYTFCNSSSYDTIPIPSDFDADTDSSNLHKRSAEMAKHDIGGVRWLRHNNTPKPNHYNDEKASYVSAQSVNDYSATFYTTSIQIPITHPQQKKKRSSTYIAPSFNSCIICRNYALEVKIAYRCSSSSKSPSACSSDSESMVGSRTNSGSVLMDSNSSSLKLGLSSNITLKVPLQISFG